MDSPIFDFGVALAVLKDGKRVWRKAWKNVYYLYLVDGSEFEINREPLKSFYSSLVGTGTKVKYRPHIDMLGSEGTFGTWSPSMEDILANDWCEFLLQTETIN